MWYIVEQVALRQHSDIRKPKTASKTDAVSPTPMEIGHAGADIVDSSGDEYMEGYPQETNDALAVQQGRGKGFKGQCIHCGTFGHCVSECPQKDAEMAKARGKGYEWAEGGKGYEWAKGGKGYECSPNGGYGPIWGQNGGNQRGRVRAGRSRGGALERGCAGSKSSSRTCSSSSQTTA